MDSQRTDKKDAGDSVTKTVEIKITAPSLGSLLANLKAAARKVLKAPKKALLIAGILGLVVVAALITYVKFTADDPTKIALGTRDISRPAGNLQRGTPDYQTVLPAGKDIESLGGWTRVSPPESNPVFAYVDKIGAIPITVSQQPLPKGFKAGSDAEIEQLAIGYKANEKITVGNISVHIGTSAKGPQSVIFSKGKLLILIKSSAKIKNDQWAAYINSLR